MVASSATRRWRGRIRPSDPPLDAAGFLRLLVERGNFIFVSTTVRREALARAGGFDTARTSVEDYDLWIRILALGYEAVHAEGRLAIKRDRETAMSVNLPKMLTNLRDVYRHTERDYDVPDDVRAVAGAHADRIDRELAKVTRGGAAAGAVSRARLALEGSTGAPAGTGSGTATRRPRSRPRSPTWRGARERDPCGLGGERALDRRRDPDRGRPAVVARRSACCA